MGPLSAAAKHQSSYGADEQIHPSNRICVCDDSLMVPLDGFVCCATFWVLPPRKIGVRDGHSSRTGFSLVGHKVSDASEADDHKGVANG
jgi:hypothetical protein